MWKPNQAVVVYDPLNGFDNETLVIAEVTYSQDNNGTLTEIRVADLYKHLRFCDQNVGRYCC
ncbi:baseplate protein [Salmonella enterica subsp. indica]|uniref:Baseplate protein n=1 Tax=Salmonella enterica subsp. indica TaxID=59207 RepID=A0A379XTR5_SALER|nr:baseplate protein [Salmonella enterica subsp. indica]